MVDAARPRDAGTFNTRNSLSFQCIQTGQMENPLTRPLPSLATFACLLALLFPAIAAPASGQTPQGTTGLAASSLKAAISVPNATTNGVAIAPDGRMFMVIQKQKGQDVPQIAEFISGQLKPYPDASWNGWKPGDDASHAFVHANSIRFGLDGTLWVVDFGSADTGFPIVAHGPKLVGIDVSTGKVVRTFYLDKATKPNSAVDDVRFNGDHAYLTDAGWPGIIVLHMPEGSMYRALSDQPSTTAQKPLFAEGHQLQTKDGQPVYFHADQLEVSPDGATLYYQPCSGPMAAIATQYIDDRGVADEERTKHVRLFVNNGTAGGTAIDSKGNVYVSDTQHDAVLRVSPTGKVETLVQDPRLVWVDAMWITADGRLWMPAAQMDHTPNFNGGKTDVQYPMTVFTVDIGNGPARNDHK